MIQKCQPVPHENQWDFEILHTASSTIFLKINLPNLQNIGSIDVYKKSSPSIQSVIHPVFFFEIYFLKGRYISN